MRAALTTLAVFALAPLLACESSEPAPAPVRTQPTASSVPEPPAAPPAADAPKHRLDDRSELRLDAIREARSTLLAGLVKAKTLLAQRKPAEALATLEQLGELDPSGSVLAIEALKAAVAAEKEERQQHWARAAVSLAGSDEALLARVKGALGKAGDTPPAATPSAKLPEQKDVRAACDAIVRELSAGRIALPLVRTKPAELRCEQDYELPFTGTELRRAVSLRVEGKAGGQLRLGWVGLETPKGLVLHGPVATSWSPESTGATNDFEIDLQQIDVLPGGSPEVVVRVSERSTLPDIARNEVAEIDRTRVRFLSLDRGRPAVSKELLLSRRARARPIDPKDRRMPAGWARSQKLGAERAFELKVEWGGANEIRLSKASGNEDPPEQGTISLFP
jgi:hypothetical protein